MKFLLVSLVRVDTSDIPLFLKRALLNEGHEAELISPDENATIAEVALNSNKLIFSSLGLAAFGRRVRAAARRIGPDCLYLHGANFYLSPRAISNIKREVNCKVAIWEGNIQYFRWFQGEAIKLYDMIFVGDSYTERLLKGPAGAKEVVLLGPACDPEFHYSPTLTGSDRERFHAEISFIGSGFQSRIRMFERLTQHDLRLWGRNWDRSDDLAQFFHDEPVYGLKKNKIYSASKISINIQNPATQINGVSNRIFEILACGGFPLTEYRSDVERYFEIGKEVAVFDGADDLVNKVQYYLAHPEERQGIVERGRARCLEQHTYQHRARTIVEYLSK